MTVGKILGWALLALMIVLGLGWIAEGNDFFMYKFFAPRQEAVRRQVFEQTRSFNAGMIQELENMQFQYSQQKDAATKAALRSIILHRASGYNLEDPDVPNSLREFISRLKETN